MLNSIKHLLPRARAWNLTQSKTLRQYFAGLSIMPAQTREFIDKTYLDMFPATTRCLDEWEAEFALPDTGLTDAERRTRLAGAWKVTGQKRSEIQASLVAAGFPVFVTEAYTASFPPSVNSCPTVLNPFTYLDPESTDPVPPLGYALINGILETEKILTSLAGEPTMQAGEPLAQAGEYTAFLERIKPHSIPTDPACWTLFLYIGALPGSPLVQIPQIRRQEFEALCLKIKPCSNWLGMLVEYV